MKHKHADLMMEYAKDAQETDRPWERWEYSYEWMGYMPCSVHPSWASDCGYRRIDPYREFREAQERGDMIQLLKAGEWCDLDFSPMYDEAPDRYRIKPKTKTLYLWAGKGSNQEWTMFKGFHEDDKHVRRVHRGCTNFKRLDYTAIEVEA